MEGAYHLITEEQMAILGASASGSFVALLMKRPDWKVMGSWFIVSLLSAFYLVAPMLMIFGWGSGYAQLAGFGWGALGMVFWAAVYSLSQRLSDDPLGTVDSIWRMIRGQKGGEA